MVIVHNIDPFVDSFIKKKTERYSQGNLPQEDPFGCSFISGFRLAWSRDRKDWEGCMNYSELFGGLCASGICACVCTGVQRTVRIRTGCGIGRAVGGGVIDQ